MLWQIPSPEALSTSFLQALLLSALYFISATVSCSLVEGTNLGQAKDTDREE